MNRICEQVRDLLSRDRGNLNFSPSAHYAVQKLIDYAEQEHEQREKAEERCVKLQTQVADACHMGEAQARTIDDLRQQLSFMQQARWGAGGCDRMNRDVLFSSATDEWATPQGFFDELNSVFHFDLDAAATAQNHKCETFYTREQDGLRQPWVGNVWCNPPYGRTIGSWVQKASEENAKNNNLIVMLLPARTDTKWFHNYCYRKPNVEIEFIKSRLKFGESKNSAPFPSMLVIFKPKLWPECGGCERWRD